MKSVLWLLVCLLGISVNGQITKPQWKQIGPAEDTKAVTFNPFFGQVMGKVVSLFVDKVADPSGNTIYAGTESSGLWKTTDFGESWKNVTDVIPLSCGVFDVTCDPRIPGIIFIATGMNSAGIAEYGQGIFKSVDGGKSWKQVYGSEWDFSVMNRILISREDGNVIFCFAKDKVIRSKDGGNTWTVIFGEGGSSLTQDYLYKKKILIDMEMKPGDGRTLYICSTGFQDWTTWKWHTAEIWKTKNALSKKVKWERVDSRLSKPMISRRYELSVTPLDPDAVFVAGADTISSGANKKVRIYKSENNGKIWKLRYEGQLFLADEHRLELAVSPTDTMTLYVGGGFVQRFRPEPVMLKPSVNMKTGHVDTRALVLINGSAPGTNGGQDSLLIGNDGGVSFCPDGGRNKEVISLNGKGLILSQFYGIGGADAFPDIISGGTLDNGIFTDTSGSWYQLSGGGDAGDVLIDPDDPGRMYCNIWGSDNFNYGIKYTNDSWKTSGVWSTKIFSNESSHFNRPLRFHPGSRDTLYAGFHNVWRTFNARDAKTARWDSISSFSSANAVSKGETLSAIAVTPSDDNIVFAAFNNPEWDKEKTVRKFFRTNDQWSKHPEWANLSENPGLESLRSSFITDIAVSPTNAGKIWISLSGIRPADKVLFSGDGGMSWKDYSKGLPKWPVHCIRYMEGSNDGLFLGTDNGIYYTNADLYKKSGWVSWNGNLPAVVVHDIEINEKHNLIRIGTFGRGIWEATMP